MAGDMHVRHSAVLKSDEYLLPILYRCLCIVCTIASVPAGAVAAEWDFAAIYLLRTEVNKPCTMLNCIARLPWWAADTAAAATTEHAKLWACGGMSSSHTTHPTAHACAVHTSRQAAAPPSYLPASYLKKPVVAATPLPVELM
jgi:hypothetical protein